MQNEKTNKNPRYHFLHYYISVDMMISRENMQALKIISIITHASNTLGKFTQSSIKLLKNVYAKKLHL